MQKIAISNDEITKPKSYARRRGFYQKLFYLYHVVPSLNATRVTYGLLILAVRLLLYNFKEYPFHSLG